MGLGIVLQKYVKLALQPWQMHLSEDLQNLASISLWRAMDPISGINADAQSRLSLDPQYQVLFAVLCHVQPAKK